MKKKVKRARRPTPYNALLEVCKKVYRKHVLLDDEYGWESLTEELGEILCEKMGCANFNKWIESVKR